MITVGAFEAKTKLSELLDRVERGEEVAITRHGKPLARMVRDERAAKPDGEELMRRFHAMRERLHAEGVSWTIDDIIAAKNDGQR